MKVIPYINFYGNCEEALNFYKDIFKASVEIQRYSDMPPSEDFPVAEENKDKIMHAAMTFNDNVIYFDDNLMSPAIEQSRVTITVEFDSEAEIDAAFATLAEGGTITMPLEDQFWGAKFGSVTDKFGIYWALDFAKPQ